MKTTNFWKTLCLSAVMLTAGAMVSCEPEDKDTHDDSFPAIDVTLLSDSDALSLDGGDVHFKIVSNGDWSVEATDLNGEVYSDVQFLPASGTGGTPDMIVRVGKWSEDRIINVTFTATKIINNRDYFDYENVPIYQNENGENMAGDGSLEKPFSIAEVLAKCKDLGADVESTEAYYIEGTVVSIKEGENFNESSYGNATFYLGDTLDADKDNQFYVYRAYYFNNKKWTSSYPALEVGDDVIVYGKIINYKGNTPETVQNTSYVFEHNGVRGDVAGPSTPDVDITHQGTAEDPFTVAEAIVKAYEVGETATTEIYYVKGLVNSIQSQYDTQYGNAIFDIADELNSQYVFTAYQVNWLENKAWTEGDGKVHVGDEVVICGQIVNYKGNTPELNAKSGYLYSLKCNYTEPELTTSTTSLVFESAGGEKSFKFESENLTEEIKATVEGKNADAFSATVSESTVTVTATENTDSEAREATLVVASGTVSFTVALSQYAAGMDVETVTIDFAKQEYDDQEKLDGKSIELDGIKIAFANNGASTAIAYYNTGGIRMYPKNQIKITSSNTIVRVVLNGTVQANNAGTKPTGIAANTGAVEELEWSGSTTDLTLTAEGSAGHYRIASAVVYYAK